MFDMIEWYIEPIWARSHYGLGGWYRPQHNYILSYRVDTDLTQLHVVIWVDTDLRVGKDPTHLHAMISGWYGPEITMCYYMYMFIVCVILGNTLSFMRTIFVVVVSGTCSSKAKGPDWSQRIHPCFYTLWFWEFYSNNYFTLTYLWMVDKNKWRSALK